MQGEVKGQRLGPRRDLGFAWAGGDPASPSASRTSGLSGFVPLHTSVVPSAPFRHVLVLRAGGPVWSSERSLSGLDPDTCQEEGRI